MSEKPLFQVIDAGGGRFIKAWINGVPVEDKAVEQLKQCARMPFVRPYVAAMPDMHWGMGSTVGSVIPTEGAIIPAAVGVDIGCGVLACQINRHVNPVDYPRVRQAIEAAVPHGRTDNGGNNDRGAWYDVPEHIFKEWIEDFDEEYSNLVMKHPGAYSRNAARQLGTLGTGNHFIELSVDENENQWIVLHSGSRGLGNRIGSYFTKLAKQLCERWHVPLIDPNLAFLPQGDEAFDDYLRALNLAQRFAWANREIMLGRIMEALATVDNATVHCHHNYTAQERHHGKDLFVTRKGAIRAGQGEMGIIPGSMGAKTYIVRGKGSSASFCSASHGAGRAMGRQEAKKRFTVEDHIKATEGVECHKGVEVLDETPGAYKPIEAVMAAQADLVEIVHTLKQVISVKGLGD